MEEPAQEAFSFVTEKASKSVTKVRMGRPRKYYKRRPATPAERQRFSRKRRKQSQQLVYWYWRSTTDLRETPQDFFNDLDREFHFTLDVCAIQINTKCTRFYSSEQDGLLQDWAGEVCWMNPPYGLILRQWTQKAYEASKAGATVVCLLPVRSDTKWWHQYVLPYAEIRYLERRLKFGGSPHNAAFPCAVAIFRPLVCQ
jgi:phage N-6-adenine-methyltransferase